MISNRQNSRRRGRGGSSQRSSGSSSGQRDSGNRIDSRARGNAAQLLEKYKNMARDAQMQGDRVNTEYYLQFADHYFRVLSDSRSRYDDQRPQSQTGGFDNDDEDYGDEGEPIRAGEQANGRDDGNRDDGRRDDARRDDGRNDSQRRDYGQRDDYRRDSQPRNDQARDTQSRDYNRDSSRDDSRNDQRSYQASNGHAPYGNGAVNEVAPQPDEKSERKPSSRSRTKAATAPASEAAPTFDAALLPPSLGVTAAPATEEKPKRKRGRPSASEGTQAG